MIKCCFFEMVRETSEELLTMDASLFVFFSTSPKCSWKRSPRPIFPYNFFVFCYRAIVRRVLIAG